MPTRQWIISERGPRFARIYGHYTYVPHTYVPPRRPTGPLGAQLPVEGLISAANSQWMELALGVYNFAQPMYAISDVLTVVPEPGSMVLACLAATGLAVSLLRQRRQCRL